MKRSLLVYAAVMAYLVAVKVVLVLAETATVIPEQAEAFAWPVIGVVALVGGLCVWLQPRVGVPALLDPDVSNRKRVLIPVLVGLGVGTINLVVQTTTGLAHTVAEIANIRAINVPFPDSIAFYTGGAIILEAIYRLIGITLPLWLIANVILRGRGRTVVFWILALLICVHEPIAQASILAGHPGLMIASALSTFPIDVFGMFLLRRAGWLAPLSFRLALYLVAHVGGSVLGL